MPWRWGPYPNFRNLPGGPERCIWDSAPPPYGPSLISQVSLDLFQASFLPRIAGHPHIIVFLSPWEIFLSVFSVETEHLIHFHNVSREPVVVPQSSPALPALIPARLSLPSLPITPEIQPSPQKRSRLIQESTLGTLYSMRSMEGILGASPPLGPPGSSSRVPLPGPASGAGTKHSCHPHWALNGCASGRFLGHPFPSPT